MAMRLAVPIIVLLLTLSISAQKFEREFAVNGASLVTVINSNGRVSVTADDTLEGKIIVSVESPQAVTAADISFKPAGNDLEISTGPIKTKKRFDITVRTPGRTRLKIKTEGGEVQIAGSISSAEVLTDTGTISTNIPLDSVKFNFLWLSSLSLIHI